MSTVQLLLFFHLLGAFMIAAGAALGEVLLAAMKRTRNTEALAALVKAASRVPMLTIPGALIALVFGSALVSQAGYKFSELWISLAYLAWIVAIALSGSVLGRAERRWKALAASELASGRAESPALAEAVADPTVSIVTHVLGAFVLLFLFLMVFKPGH